MANVSGPFVVGNVAGRVARHKNSGGHANRIEPSVSERDLVQHFADARAIGDIAAQANGRAAIRNARPRHTDADAEFVRDFLRRWPSPRLRSISTQTTCAPSRTSRCAVSLPMPEPAPMTTTTCRASSFSAGIRFNFASSSSQYSMSKASCCGSETYWSIASAPRMTSTAQL